MRTYTYMFVLLIFLLSSCSSSNDSATIKKIFESATTDTTAYHTLRILSKEYPYRLSGTAISAEGIGYIKGVMEKSGFDTVYLQECYVAHWKRGEQEVGKIISKKMGTKDVNICALGNSVGTPHDGIKASVVEVSSFEELDQLGEKNIKGKIVFYNKAMEYASGNPYEGYGSVVGFRFAGASAASRYGAIAVLVRSVTASIDTFPHTGVMRYENTSEHIPAMAIATKHANLLSSWLKDDPKLQVYIKADCQMLSDEIGYNVIGEVRGSKHPDEIITVGGHFDTWDNTEGAHDDGAGCVQSIDVLRIFNAIGYKPARTLRVVMFIDEEMNQRGGRKYAEVAKQKNENHIFAFESDGGAGKPLGFSFDLDSARFAKISSYRTLFEPYGAGVFVNEGAGVDIEFLKQSHNAALATLYADPTHYFDYHHSGFDTFETIDYKSLQQGGAAMAALIYLVDKYGVN
jgi:hypothetical protein